MKLNNRYFVLGFTLVEVLVAGTILAFASFGLMALLRLSDHMTFRAKSDAKVSQIVRSRIGNLVEIPFDRMREYASENPSTFDSTSGISTKEGVRYVFKRGMMPPTTNNVSGNIFPFIDPSELWEGHANSAKYLLSSPPVVNPSTNPPTGTGTTPTPTPTGQPLAVPVERKVYGYEESVELEFIPLKDYDLADTNVPAPLAADVLAASYCVVVRYNIMWQDQIAAGPPWRKFTFEFTKYDQDLY